MPHACLLTAPAGSGKLALAKWIARYLLCDLAGADKKECNAHWFDSEEGHPDCRVLLPEGKLQVIKVDEVRELIEQLTQTAQQGGFRVVIIQGADRMNQSASNALLKTLEEPGERTCLILLASQLESVLPTIRSRCQHWDVSAGHEQAKIWLNTACPGQDIEFALALSQGAPLRAKEIIESEQLKLCLGFITGIIKAEHPTVLSARMDKELGLTPYVQWLCYWVADCIRGLQGSKPQIFVSMNIHDYARRYDLATWFQVLDRCYRGLKLSQQPVAINQQLLLESLLIALIPLPCLE